MDEMGDTEKSEANFNDPYWNLAQLLAWVLLFDKKQVHRASDNTHDHGTIWEELRTPDGETRLVEIRCPRPSGVNILLHAAWRTAEAELTNGFETAKAQKIGYEEFKLELERKLQSGELTAFGLRNGDGTITKIPSFEWANLKVTFDPDRATSKAGSGFWTNLKFQQQEVLKLWPGPEAEKYPANRNVSTSRHDGLRREMEAAYLLFGQGYDPTPDEVFQKIREFKGKAGSCIHEIQPDKTIIWNDTAGSPQKTKWPEFKKRCSRLRGSR